MAITFLATAERILSTLLPHAVAWFNKPQPLIAFDETGGIDETKDDLYVRVRVSNQGRHVAKGCRVFLTEINEHLGGTWGPNWLFDSKQVAWAGYSFEPRDLPPHANFKAFADVVRISKHTGEWNVCAPLFASDLIKSEKFRGTYRFTLLLTGDFAQKATCMVAVRYEGDWNNLRAWQV